MKTNFFTLIEQILKPGGVLKISVIRDQTSDTLTVCSTYSEESQQVITEAIKPLVIKGQPNDLDERYIEVVEPIINAIQGLTTNVPEVLESISAARDEFARKNKKSKNAGESATKLRKEDEPKRTEPLSEKEIAESQYEATMFDAEQLRAKSKFAEAIQIMVVKFLKIRKHLSAEKVKAYDKLLYDIRLDEQRRLAEMTTENHIDKVESPEIPATGFQAEKSSPFEEGDATEEEDPFA